MTREQYWGTLTNVLRETEAIVDEIMDREFKIICEAVTGVKPGLE